MRNTLYKAYLDDFAAFVHRLGGTTGGVMGELLSFEVSGWGCVGVGGCLVGMGASNEGVIQMDSAGLSAQQDGGHTRPHCNAQPGPRLPARQSGASLPRAPPRRRPACRPTAAHSTSRSTQLGRS
jgi:hypothetical protein